MANDLIRVVSIPGPEEEKKHDGIVYVFFAKIWKEKGAKGALPFLLDGEPDKIERFAKRLKFKPKPADTTHFDRSSRARVALAALPRSPRAFDLLELARKAIEPLFAAKVRRLWIDLRAVPTEAPALADAFVSAVLAAAHEPPKYKADKPPAAPKAPPSMTIVCSAGSHVRDVERRAKRAAHVTEGTNLVRRLSALAGNDLTPSRYVKLATDLAVNAGLKTEFYSLEKLADLNAGAFLAVSQGSIDRGGGVLVVRHSPKDAGRRVALVGKGITFDTGGSNLKTGGHMFGMNGDMGGSAVVLALVHLAARLNWPVAVSAYLAIAENSLSPSSYRPNDVVRALSGKTIEVIDTDAEGRMVLADTLALAGKETPDLMLDFATLTGGCIRALSTSFSGAYTNRAAWYGRIRKAGVASGERVWPFPNDRDYGRCLKSEVADIKQCRQTGGADHIEAGYFLREFVPAKVPWVHIDMAAAEADEGLAHVPPKLTGFGVRFGAEFIETWMKR